MKKYSSTEPLYLDYNATTPVDPRVLDQMLPWFSQHFGNASSSLHAYGWRAAEAVKLAREQTAELIGAEPVEIFFTSGATESLNLAIKGLYESAGSSRRKIIAISTEHKAVLDTLGYLQTKGAEVMIFGVNQHGLPDLEALKNATDSQTLAIIAMVANNETGILLPVAEIAEIAHAAGAVSICDATQACGKIPVHIMQTGSDLLALSAHKFYGPKGSGALYIRRKNPRIRLIAQIHGGGHQDGIRSGTLNVPGIVGLGAAATLAHEFISNYLNVETERNTLEMTLQALGGIVLGTEVPRIPNTINCRFPGIDVAKLIAALPELALSTGSACSSASVEPSHVLTAMGLSVQSCRESLRISMGINSTKEKTDYISTKFSDAVQKLLH